jgi:hypothetical protein
MLFDSEGEGMKITVASDIHLEMGPINELLPTGEILILGGDITLTGIFDPDSELYQHALLTERTEAFLDQCKDSFERVFYLVGNHEAYNSNLSITPAIIKKHFKQVTLLDDKAVDLGDNVILVGGTLWTDMNGGKNHHRIGKPEGSTFRQAAMNDFNLIAMGGRLFTTHDAVARFNKTKAFIGKTAEANPDKTIVVATHHSPSIKGINPAHTYSSINAGYFTDLHGFIKEHPNIKWWSFGHTHMQKAFKIHQCTAISNARGYIGQEHSADTFNFDCWFDPVTGKKHGLP